MAAGMDPEHLKNTYGDRIVFWGGGVDTQKTLPFGTPEAVREEVLQRFHEGPFTWVGHGDIGTVEQVKDTTEKHLRRIMETIRLAMASWMASGAPIA